MCFLFCLAEIRTRKLALFQDPECERCTADKIIFGSIQKSHLPAMMENTANIQPFQIRRKPIFFHNLLFHCRAPKKIQIFRHVKVSACRVWEVDQIFFLSHSLRNFEETDFGGQCQLLCVFVRDFQQC